MTQLETDIAEYAGAFGDLLSDEEKNLIYKHILDWENRKPESQPIPVNQDEIKKWIEDEAKLYADKTYMPEMREKAAGQHLFSLQSFKAGATSLYQHLQENGRVAELEGQLKKSLDLYNKQTKTILKLEKELEELRSDYRLNL